MSFRSDFVWGAASAAYQIEGAADEDGRGKTVWDVFSHTPGKTYGGHTGDVACDSYHRFEEDLEALLLLGVRHYRFGIGWTRIFPDGRTLNERGFAYYDKVVDLLLKNGITPWITLYHWDTPQALEDGGGWQNRETAELLGRFAGVVAAHFGGHVSHYFTLNEPQCFIGLGYDLGIHAPGKRLSGAALFACWHNAMLAHGLMTRAVRAANPAAKIGLASCGLICYPASDSTDDFEAAREATFSFDRFAPMPLFSQNAFLDPAINGLYPDHPFFRSVPFPEEDLAIIRQPIDFIGLNFYNAHEVKMGENGPEIVPFHRGYPRTAMRWPITPSMMYYGTRLIYERYGLPIYITENGLSCNDKFFLDGRVHDPDRIDFLQRYLRELRHASEAGADVRGYFHWSLLDNFEWSNGYEERFGLFYVDYTTLKRHPKDSALWYRSIVEHNGETL
ncbi:MAG: beta-glucosidase [Clostridiales bacterium]|nr:beta-glucosidase [Clostridiales bacterium]